MVTKAKPRELDALFTSQTESLPAHLQVVTGNNEQQYEFDDVTSLNNVLAELGDVEGDNNFVIVQREVLLANGKREDEHVDRFPISEFTLDGLKARWGAGRYKIYVYQAGRIATRKVISIAKDPASAQPLHAPAATNDLSPIIMAMQDGFAKIFDAMKSNAPPPAPAPTRADMLAEMSMMRDMFAAPPQVPQAPAAQQFMDAMKLGMEMAQNAGGGGDSNNAWVSKVIDQLAPILLPPLIEGVQKRVAVAGAPAPSPARSLPAPAAPEAQTETEENPVNIIVIQYLNLLKKAAEQKAPVEEYADSILASVPLSSVVELENLLRPAGWRVELQKHTAVVEQHPVWFTSLRDTVLQYIDEDKATALDLTDEHDSGSVTNHENADTGILAKNEGNTGITV